MTFLKNLTPKKLILIYSVSICFPVTFLILYNEFKYDEASTFFLVTILLILISLYVFVKGIVKLLKYKQIAGFSYLYLSVGYALVAVPIVTLTTSIRSKHSNMERTLTLENFLEDATYYLCALLLIAAIQAWIHFSTKKRAQ